MTVPSDFDKPTGQVIHGATEFTEPRDRSVWFVLFFVAAAFLVEITGRLFRSSIPVPVPEVISLAAILMLLAPALYLILRRRADIVLRCSIILAVTFAILSQVTIICESTPYCDAWPILSRHSRWHGTARSICQVFGLVLLLGTFYFSLLSALRAKAVLLRHGQNLAREVVERQRAEGMYRRENIFREAIIENSAEGLCVCHAIDEFPYLTFTVWNRRMTDITGYTMEEIDRLGWYQSMYPDPELQTRAVERMARMRNGDNLEKEEWLVMRKDGARRTLSISTSIVNGFGEQPHVLAVMSDITAHKGAEEALEREAMLRRALFEKSRDGIAVVTLNGTVFEANEAMAEMLGYTSEELGRLHISDWDAQWTDDQIAGKLREQSITGATFETLHRRKDGSLYNVEVSANAVTVGEQVLIYSVHRDISRRKRAEAALLESETRYRSIVSTATEGIWGVDEDRLTTFVNARVAEILGYQEEEMLGKHVDEFVWEDDAPTLHAQMNARRQGMRNRYELRFRHKSGNAVWTLVSGAPIVDSAGQFTGSFAMLTDITERKQAEDALRESEEKYRLIFDGTKEAILFLDAGNRQEFFNYRLAEICGYTAEELACTPVMSLVHPDDSARIRESNRRRFAGEVFEHTYEFRMLHKDGHPVEVEGRFDAIKRDDRVIGICGLLRDISDRKRAQAELDMIRAYAPCLLWHADVESLDGKPQWSISVSSEEAAQRFMPLNLDYTFAIFDGPEMAMYAKTRQVSRFCTTPD